MNDFSIMVREERPDYKAVNNGFQSLDIVELLSLIVLFISIFLYLCSGKVIAIYRRIFIRFEVYNIQSAAVK